MNKNKEQRDREFAMSLIDKLEEYIVDNYIIVRAGTDEVVENMEDEERPFIYGEEYYALEDLIYDVIKNKSLNLNQKVDLVLNSIFGEYIAKKGLGENPFKKYATSNS